MTNRDERRLRAVLAAVQDYGFADAIGHLRVSLGAPFGDAALAGRRAHRRRQGAPPPAALMPVWAEPDRGSQEDPLLSSARLWNGSLLLRVEDDDDPIPVPPVRERFNRWVRAASTGPG